MAIHVARTVKVISIWFHILLCVRPTAKGFKLFKNVYSGRMSRAKKILAVFSLMRSHYSIRFWREVSIEWAVSLLKYTLKVIQSRIKIGSTS